MHVTHLSLKRKEAKRLHILRTCIHDKFLKSRTIICLPPVQLETIMEPLHDSEHHDGKSESPISLPSNQTQAMESPFKLDKSHLSIYENGRIKYRNDAEHIWNDREIPRILSASESVDLIARSLGLTCASGSLNPSYLCLLILKLRASIILGTT